MEMCHNSQHEHNEAAISIHLNDLLLSLLDTSYRRADDVKKDGKCFERVVLTHIIQFCYCSKS